jgi:DNA-binding NarL/FixJ family response regulator
MDKHAMAVSQRISVLCVDDHPLFRAGIAYVLENQPDIELVGLAATGAEGIALARQHSPDVTLMDLRLPDMSGIAAVSAICHHRPEARILMLTTFEGDAEVRRALAAGARAYVLKSASPEELVNIIRQVNSGKNYLPAQIAVELARRVAHDAISEREAAVLRLIAGGNRNKDIAEKLSIAEDTVKAHIKRIMEKLGARDRTQAVSIAVQRGIIQL